MRITLGVTGGVAAYKAAELVRRLQQEGFSVEVAMTRAACEFITPLTFAALTGKKVITGLFAESSGDANLESAIEHIAVAQRTDLLLVAPATADIIAKFSRGISDDFLSTLYLATTAPVVTSTCGIIPRHRKISSACAAAAFTLSIPTKAISLAA